MENWKRPAIAGGTLPRSVDLQLELARCLGRDKPEMNVRRQDRIEFERSVGLLVLGGLEPAHTEFHAFIVGGNDAIVGRLVACLVADPKDFHLLAETEKADFAVIFPKIANIFTKL